MDWIVWSGNDSGPDGFENNKFECMRRDGNVFRSDDVMSWAIGYVDWRHNRQHPDSDFVFYRFVENSKGN